jgi:hypothetical protein
VISTGTGGAIGRHLEVDDVIVSQFVAFDPMGDAPALQPFSCDVASVSTDSPRRASCSQPMHGFCRRPAAVRRES